jgi:hypothetical protein
MVGAATVSWFDDTGSGDCRLPAAWRLLYQDAAGAWRPVEGVRGTTGSEESVTGACAAGVRAVRKEIESPLKRKNL